MTRLSVVAPGPMCTVQDLGRTGLRHLGIGESGAADRVSLRSANLLVGNICGAAALELTLGRLRARFDQDTVIAAAGAPCPVTVGGTEVGFHQRIRVPADTEIRFGATTSGLRTYLAVAGGVDVPMTLHSRSTDTLSGIGPGRVVAGTVLPIGTPETRAVADADPPVECSAEPVLRIRPGPRDDWFVTSALDTLCTARWAVTIETNRVGARLAGPALDRCISQELPSEPMVAGALQVPPNGQPILFLADHPVTGGYPVIAVVGDADLHLAGQLRPGQHVRFAL